MNVCLSIRRGDSNGDIFNGSAKTGHLMPLKMCQADKNIGVHDGTSYFGACNVLAALHRHVNIVSSFKTVSDQHRTADGQRGKSILPCTLKMLQSIFPAARVQGAHITTLEGVQAEAEEFSRFLAEEGADQCGFCSPGLIMNVLALKKENPHPTEAEMKEYLAGNLCRCTGYQVQYRALVKYFGIEEVQQG